jgi:cation/acetate symporter
MGIFWKRASKWGAIMGMLAGMGICLYYMVNTYPFFTKMFAIAPMPLWFGLNPISAGMFGVPVGLVTIFVVSLLTPAPDKEVQELVDHVRYPNLTGDIDTRGT